MFSLRLNFLVHLFILFPCFHVPGIMGFLRGGGDSPKVPQSSQTESLGFPRVPPPPLGSTPGPEKEPYHGSPRPRVNLDVPGPGSDRIKGDRIRGEFSPMYK